MKRKYWKAWLRNLFTFCKCRATSIANKSRFSKKAFPQLVLWFSTPRFTFYGFLTLCIRQTAAHSCLQAADDLQGCKEFKELTDDRRSVGVSRAFIRSVHVCVCVCVCKPMYISVAVKNAINFGMLNMWTNFRDAECIMAPTHFFRVMLMPGRPQHSPCSWEWTSVIRRASGGHLPVITWPRHGLRRTRSPMTSYAASSCLQRFWRLRGSCKVGHTTKNKMTKFATIMANCIRNNLKIL